MKLIYQKGKEQFVVISEFSLLPIESFFQEQDAKDFIKGFNKEDVKEQSCAFLKGLLYRKYFDQDMQNGYPFKKYHELAEVS